MDGLVLYGGHDEWISDSSHHVNHVTYSKVSIFCKADRSQFPAISLLSNKIWPDKLWITTPIGAMLSDLMTSDIISWYELPSCNEMQKAIAGPQCQTKYAMDNTRLSFNFVLQQCDGTIISSKLLAGSTGCCSNLGFFHKCTTRLHHICWLHKMLTSRRCYGRYRNEADHTGVSWYFLSMHDAIVSSLMPEGPPPSGMQ